MRSKLKSENDSLVLKVGQVAEQLQCSDLSVRRLVWSGRLKKLKGFRHIRVPATELQRFILDNT